MEEKIQTVLFIRHGVARHNLVDPATGEHPNLRDPTLLDPPLVDRGKMQAVDAGERIRIWWDTTQVGEKVELVITSPLTRCMQTAHLAFLPGQDYSNSERPTPPIFCLEQVREAYGIHYPDKRRDKRLLQKHWPLIQFDPSMTDSDEQWKENSRETLDDVIARVDEFLQWLAKRQETNIVVVSHGVWIECCFRTYFPDVLADGRRVYNCDCFAGDLVSSQGEFLRLNNFRNIS